MRDTGPEMRDIRPDLRERLAENAARQHEEIAEFERKFVALQKSHKAALDVLGRERAALEQLLESESERHGMPALTRAQKIATLVPLADFLVTKVQAHGPIGKDPLLGEAKLAGYLAAANGRTFHITLMNLAKRGRLVRLPNGQYVAPAREPAMFDQSEEGEMQTLM
jgi:hypothetical protein